MTVTTTPTTLEVFIDRVNEFMELPDGTRQALYLVSHGEGNAISKINPDELDIARRWLATNLFEGATAARRTITKHLQSIHYL